MNMIKIRVMSDNLEELLGQFMRGEHVEPRDKTGPDHAAEGTQVKQEENQEENQEVSNWSKELKAEWWTAIRGVAATLAREFNLAPDEFASPQGFTAMFLANHPKRKSDFIVQTSALLQLARKILADMSAAEAKSSLNPSP